MNKIYKSAMAFHPGEYLLDELNERNLTQTALAKILGKPIKTINEIVKGKKSITAEMAILFEGVFASSASSWLGLQKAYDLSSARAINNSKYKIVIKNYKNYQEGKTELIKKTSNQVCA